MPFQLRVRPKFGLELALILAGVGGVLGLALHRDFGLEIFSAAAFGVALGATLGALFGMIFGRAVRFLEGDQLKVANSQEVILSVHVNNLEREKLAGKILKESGARIQILNKNELSFPPINTLSERKSIS